MKSISHALTTGITAFVYKYSSLFLLCNFTFSIDVEKGIALSKKGQKYELTDKSSKRRHEMVMLHYRTGMLISHSYHVTL